MNKFIIGILIVVVLLGVYGFSVYNGLVTLNVAADTQWQQVETDYQRRFDLIPNLVESVKGLMKQEQKIFGDIATARTLYSGARIPDAKAAAAGQVEGALGRLLVVMENYPPVQSSAAVQALMSQLEGSENRISVERKRYNDAVQAYNLKVMRFPSSLVAGMTGFHERAYFEAAAGAENAPAVKF